MNFNLSERQLDFVKHRNKYFLVSGLLIGLGIIILAIMGLNLGVDFVSGTTLEIMIEEHSFTAADIRELLSEQGLEPGEVVLAGEQGQFANVRFAKTLSEDERNAVLESLKEKYGAEKVTISESSVSPDIAQQLARKAVYAVLLASIGIIIYVAFRFEYRFAIAAIVALFHDTLFTIAAFSIFRLEVDLTFIAAVLTIVGYSINDTIVVFDRIRENLKIAKLKTKEDLAELVNRSIKETLARSINTSLTVIFAALALLLFGSESIRNFSLALLVGLTAGAYSSIFIAAQIWLVWKGREIKTKQIQTQ